MNTKRILGTLAGLLIATLAANATGGRIIARMNPGYDPIGLTQRFPIRLIGSTAPMPFVLFLVKPGYSVEAVEGAMRLTPDIQWVEEDGEMDETDSPDNLAGGQGAGRGSTIGAVFDPNAQRVRNLGLSAQVHYTELPVNRKSREVRVAILDTGLSPHHKGIWKNVVASKNFINPRGSAYDLPELVDSNADGTPDGALSHGTMIAGLVSAYAPASKLIIAKVADADGSATAWSLIQGYAFAVQNGAEVINISMGSILEIPALSDVLEWAETFHAVTVAAAGNNNAPEFLYPAEYSHAVSVTGVNPLDVKASYSSYDNHARIAAPSNGLYSMWWDGTMGIWSGTSFGTPLVSAAIADGLRLTRRPVSTDDIRYAVRTYGDNIDPFNPNYLGELGLRLNFQLLRPAIRALAP